MISRRSILAAAAAPALGAVSGEDAVSSLIASADEKSVAISCRLFADGDPEPELNFDGRRLRAASKASGRHFAFEVSGLEAERSYEYAIWRAGRQVSPSHTIKTLPAPGSLPRHFRALIFTCAGGHPGLNDAQGRPLFCPLSQRAALLDAGLSHSPDIVIANGDHVYWVLEGRYRAAMAESAFGKKLGTLLRGSEADSAHNVKVLDRICAPQISDLYRQRLAGIPSFFLRDDHDYFENDEASAGSATFPPDGFHMWLGDTVQRMFYPQPRGKIPTGSGLDAPVVEVNWGRLASIALYDCRRLLKHSPGRGHFVLPEYERWISDRDTRAIWRGHCPSTPMGWTAGKWAEWYGDTADGSPKQMWNSGWRDQHDRLLSSLAGRSNAGGFLIQGDLHASAAADIGLEGQRLIPAALCGTLGTGASGFPSAARGASAWAPAGLARNDILHPVERNGFAILDLARDSGSIRLFVAAEGNKVSEIAKIDIPGGTVQ